MRVLLTGATGFLGGHLLTALVAAGHQVVAVSRRPGGLKSRGVEPLALDFAQALTEAQWVPHLKGIDVVVNAVGILREAPGQSFDVLHVKAPEALFRACVTSGVRRVVQISSLGADEGAETPYHLSKRTADDLLLSLPLQATVVLPSLVYGPTGASARLFGTWATLPVVPLPGDGRQQVQPLHVDDAIEAMARLVDDPQAAHGRVALVGPVPLSLRDYVNALRKGFGMGPARFLTSPRWLVEAGATIGGWLPGSLLDRPTLAMLDRGNTAPPHDTVKLLGRAPRPAEQFAAPHRANARTAALLGWTLPLLRGSVALVWIVTGLLSLGIFPVGQSLDLLARVGAHGALAMLLLYGAAGLDFALGAATLLMRRRRALWVAQGALILGYTLLITWRLPEFWLHPFGPILKNLPMLAVLAVLWAFEEPREWNT